MVSCRGFAVLLIHEYYYNIIIQDFLKFYTLQKLRVRIYTFNFFVKFFPEFLLFVFTVKTIVKVKIRRKFE